MAQLVSITLFFLVVLSGSPALSSRVSGPFGGNFSIRTASVSNTFDKELAKFAEAFAKSPAGSLLSSIVKAIPHDGKHFFKKDKAEPSGFVTDAASGMQFPQPQGSILEGVSVAPPQRSSTILSLYITIILLAASLAFTGVVIWGGEDSFAFHCILFLNGYAVAIAVLAVFYGFIPDWLLCLLSLLALYTYLYVNYTTASVSDLMYVMIYFFSIVTASLIYDLYASLPFESINPAFTGFAGLVFNTGIFGQRFVFLRLLYIAFIALFASAIFLAVPLAVKQRPKDQKEQEFAEIYVDYMLAFCNAWVTAGLIMQLLYIGSLATFNPLDPLSFFYVPCQFRWTQWETYLAIFLWALFTCSTNWMRKVSDTRIAASPYALSRTILERWSELTGAATQ